MSRKDYYRILDLKADATAPEVTAAWQKAADRYQPGVNPNGPYAAEKTQEINEAYQVLGDPQQRARYDQQLDENTAGALPTPNQPDRSASEPGASRSGERARLPEAPRSNEPELIQFITQRLKKMVSRQKIIDELCATTDLWWAEADALVTRAEAAYHSSPHYRISTKAWSVVFSLLAMFGLLMAILLAIAVYNEEATGHSIYDSSAPNPHPCDEGCNTGPGRTRIRWFAAGQILAVHYSVTVDSDGMFMSVKRIRDFSDLSELDVTESRRGDFEIPITESGFYALVVDELYFTPATPIFSGRFDVWWDVQPAK